MGNVENEANLVCEALVREIRDASRWTAIVEGWEALLVVRRMEKQLTDEAKAFGKCYSDLTENHRPCKENRL